MELYQEKKYNSSEEVFDISEKSCKDANTTNVVNRGKWTVDELLILDKYYPLGGVSLCKEKGLNRSSYALYNKAYKRGLKKKAKSTKFKQSEIELLKKYYSIGGVLYAQYNGLYRSFEDIEKEARYLKLKRKTERDLGTNGWCAKDVDILVKYYPIGGYPSCVAKGLTKSKISAMTKANQLKLKLISKEVIQRVRNLNSSINLKTG